jgi:hypothetical protein
MNKVIRYSTLSDADATRFSQELAPGQVSTSANHGIVVARTEDIFALADQLADEEQLEHMASFRKKTTGVDNTLFISPRVHARHAARIKVAIDPPDSLNPASETASVTIHDCTTIGRMPPALLKQVCQFIELNREVLMDYWEHRIDTDELRGRLQSIEEAR